MTKAIDETLGKMPVAHDQPRPRYSDTETMRAVVWQGKRKVAVSTVPKPLVTHEADAIVRVTACTICSGSDGHIFAGEIPGIEKGQIMGHEAMGIIESTGAAVKKFKTGDRVVIAFDIACGSCEHCQKQQYTGCEATNDSKLADEFYGHAPAGLFGYGSLLGNHDGSQAEFVRVPFADVNCCRVPAEVPDEKALLISDVVCTSLHAVEMGEVKEGDTVAIWGLGPIGLCTARWCQIRGARRIVGIDLVPDRLALARRALNIEVIDRSACRNSKDLCDKLEMMEPKGFDVCIEAVGFRFAATPKHRIMRALALETDTPEIIDEGLTVLKPYGKVSIIGDYAGYANMFPVGKIMFKAATLRSAQCPVQKYFDYVVEQLRNGTFDPTFILTHNITLEDAPLAYEKLDQKEDGFVKVFIRP